MNQGTGSFRQEHRSDSDADAPMAITLAEVHFPQPQSRPKYLKLSTEGETLRNMSEEASSVTLVYRAEVSVSVCAFFSSIGSSELFVSLIICIIFLFARCNKTPKIGTHKLAAFVRIGQQPARPCSVLHIFEGERDSPFSGTFVLRPAERRES